MFFNFWEFSPIFLWRQTLTIFYKIWDCKAKLFTNLGNKIQKYQNFKKLRNQWLYICLTSILPSFRVNLAIFGKFINKIVFFTIFGKNILFCEIECAFGAKWYILVKCFYLAKRCAIGSSYTKIQVNPTRNPYFIDIKMSH